GRRPVNQHPRPRPKPRKRAAVPKGVAPTASAQHPASALGRVDPAPEWLHAATPDEFLPSRTRWSQTGGFILLLALTGLVVLSGMLNYRVTVDAHATVRPAGELRIVQAGADGAVRRILVAQNQHVQEGEVIAYIDDSRLQTRKHQLESAVIKVFEQREQADAQLTALDRQVEAEQELLARSLSAAESGLSLVRRQHREKTQTAAAEEQEAEALLDFAREDLSRYATAAAQGIVSELELKQREANLKSAEARLAQVRAALNPSEDEIDIAEEKILQTRAAGEANRAKFSKERQGLLDRRVQLHTQLADRQQDLEQVDVEIERASIRTPVSGIVQVLTLRNPGQVVAEGELVARIAPLDSDVQLKAMVARRDIAKVEVGQSVHVRISACPYPDYGTLRGMVVAVSPDTIAPEQQARSASLQMSHDASTGYEVTVRPESGVLTHAGQRCFIQPGMEGQAEILSRKETILQFFLRKARLIADV
ncbi:MAG: HlyD family efflux transporter periplasmic adaptor subunit, partial [Gammaproteobacteria bacterium]|nr:HlyD family efflux transporter periplasmic adaptor subunit [Gammaproteobacteria bacterium]